MKPIKKVICKYLISSDKIFFANLLMYVRKRESKNIPTMGVTAENGDITLIYNPEFIEEIKRTDGFNALKGILEHELLHLVHDHLSRAKKYNRHQRIYNLATDMAINQQINKDILPKSLMPTPEKLKKIKAGKKDVKCMIYPELYDLPEDKSAEYYYTELMKKAQKMSMQGAGAGGGNANGEEQQGNGIGGDSVDDHSNWGKANNGNEQITKEAIKRAVKEAYKQMKKMQGTVPAHLKEKIEELLKPPVVNWRHLLKQYIGASIKAGWKRTWKRPSRRFPDRVDIKGKTAERTLKVLVAIDTSGSVSNNEFQDFMVEMKGIMNCYKTAIDVVQCDADIQAKETLKPYKKMNIEFKGRGGTSFKPVFDYVRKRPDYDLLVYFTDGYCGYSGCKTKIPTIWVFTESGSEEEPPFGRLVRMNGDKGRK